MPPVLEVSNLTFRRGRPILKGIDWRVDPGQHWAILGPNGCGKTSLINLITGYDSATGGTLQIGDSVFGEDDWREVRRRVGLVTNTLTTYLESGEPVIDVIASGREAKLNLIEVPPEAWKREAALLLKSVGCGYLRHALWGPLSQGEKQKVLICRALMAQFDVLILDEPCAGLDPVVRVVVDRPGQNRAVGLRVGVTVVGAGLAPVEPPVDRDSARDLEGRIHVVSGHRRTPVRVMGPPRDPDLVPGHRGGESVL